MQGIFPKNAFERSRRQRFLAPQSYLSRIRSTYAVDRPLGKAAKLGRKHIPKYVSRATSFALSERFPV